MLIQLDTGLGRVFDDSCGCECGRLWIEGNGFRICRRILASWWVQALFVSAGKSANPGTDFSNFSPSSFRLLFPLLFRLVLLRSRRNLIASRNKAAPSSSHTSLPTSSIGSASRNFQSSPVFPLNTKPHHSLNASWCLRLIVETKRSHARFKLLFWFGL